VKIRGRGDDRTWRATRHGYSAREEGTGSSTGARAGGGAPGPPPGGGGGGGPDGGGADTVVRGGS
jgi:hypothetical protein